MSIRYPDGREYTPDASTIEPRAPKERDERRISAPGENNQFSIRKPAKDSPLRALAAIYVSHGWQADYIKAFCTCQDWTDKGANAVVVWKGVVHRTWCVCEVEQLSNEQMEEAAA
jgi:hypothetical protein